MENKIKKALSIVRKYEKDIEKYNSGERKRKPSKPKIGKWTSRHTHLINVAARFNIVDINNALKLTLVAGKTMSAESLAAMIINNYITVDEIDYKKKNIKFISLGTKGERKLREIDTPTTRNKYNSSTAHDLEHSNYVFENYSISDIQNYYRSEKELIKLGVYHSPTDGAFIFGGEDGREDIYVETITQYYTDDMKKYHANYVKKVGGLYDTNKVRVPKKFS